MSLSIVKKAARSAALAALAALPVFAQEGVEPPPSLFGGNFMFIMIAMFAIIYFIMIRPEQKKQKERLKMLSALKKGDRVLTAGGVIGVITAVKDSSYFVKSGEGVVIEFSKSAVQNVLTGDAPASDAENK